MDWSGKSLRLSGRGGVRITGGSQPSAVHSGSCRACECSSEAMRAEARRQACRTVVWSRPPNCLADRRQRLAGELAREVHGDLARPGDARGAGAGEELLGGDAEQLTGGGSGSRRRCACASPGEGACG